MQLPGDSLPLDSLGALRLRGADLRKFLQGQLSQDLGRLSAGHALYAGFHNPQGRVIALLWLLQLETDDLLAVLPRELVGEVSTRLRKFVLRAKVHLQDESAEWHIAGALAGDAPSAALPQACGEVARAGDAHLLRLAGPQGRFWLLHPKEAPVTRTRGGLRADDWELAAIAAGEPQVYAATGEQFVAQMLNLDLLGGIAFDKGCYTGQEVIARAHYRGRVKRRMQRFISRAPLALAPGAGGALEDGRTFQVVRAATHADGRCEFLAVAAFGTEAPASAAAAAAAVPAQPLPLPYALPQ
jgi:folate-binding protein YgfZ